MYFKLMPNSGNHAEKDPETGKVFIYNSKDGYIIESNNDLTKMFPNKFERIRMAGDDEEEVAEPALKFHPQKLSDLKAKSGAKAKTKAKTSSKPKPLPISPPPAPVLVVGDDDLEQNPLGRDVSKRFPQAQEEDFLVFANGGAFYVVETDDPTVALNEKPLKKQKVMPFIKEYLKG